MNKFGCIIDIDGVLVRDGSAIENSEKGIQLLEKHNIPYCLLSNGHGSAEYKSKVVNKALNTSIKPNQTIMAISPLVDLAEVYGDKNVLVIGKTMDLEAIKSYGYSKPIFYEDYATLWPYQFPDRQKSTIQYQLQTELNEETEIKAIFIMHTPMNWGEAAQIICDVLRSSDGSMKTLWTTDAITQQKIPIYLSNPDFDYAGKFILPRVTVGAFGEVLSMLWKRMSNGELDIVYFGKPFRAFYEKAEKVLKQMQPDIKTFYGIGDNPISDIRGANVMKSESPFDYHSVLIKSKCSAPELLKVDKPDFICDYFYEAIQTILKINGIEVD
ncbi:Haloacid dehalogenase-like hydrolase [Entamoeba marina]